MCAVLVVLAGEHVLAVSAIHLVIRRYSNQVTQNPPGSTVSFHSCPSSSFLYKGAVYGCMYRNSLVAAGHSPYACHDNDMSDHCTD